MARIAEPEKMENIKKAVMEGLIESNYASMSIASISKKAGVSQGYLYRYFNGKEELVREIVDKEMNIIISDFKADIDASSSVFEVAYKTVRKLFLRANEESQLAKFTSFVVLDMKIPSKEKLEKFKNILEVAEKLIALGRKTGEVNSQITPIDMLIVPFTIPFRYLSFLLEIDKEPKFTEDDIQRIAQICVNAVR